MPNGGGGGPQPSAGSTFKPLAHYEKVKDAVSGEAVTSDTRIAALHTFGTDPIKDQKLKNLTRVVEPAVRCWMKLNEDDWLPPTVSRRERGYDLYITYSLLMFSPRVRLECRLLDRDNLDASPFHIAALEFPFTSREDTELQGYSKAAGRRPSVKFTSRGAIGSGLGVPMEHIDRLGFHESRILEVLRDLRTDSNAKLQFVLDGSDLNPSQRKDLDFISKGLPGGRGTQYKSFTQPPYFALDDGRTMSLTEEYLKDPHTLMKCTVPFPMVQLDPREAFANTREAVIYMAYSAYHAELEARTAVELWAKTIHLGAIFRLKHHDLPVLAVRFRKDYKRLSGSREEMKFRLPRELQATGTFVMGGSLGKLRLVLDDVSGLPGHDAAFIVLNDGGFSWMEKKRKAIHDPSDSGSFFHGIKFEPESRTFTLTSYLITCNQMLAANNPWRTLLLNQDITQLSNVDLTAGCDPVDVREADNWLYGFKDWNDEQREVLERIHSAKGRMVIVKGIAGTGKTLLQSALSLYFARLGFKVLVAPPSNSNASHAAVEINNSETESATEARMAALGDTMAVLTVDGGPGASDAHHSSARKQATARDSDIVFNQRTTPRHSSPITHRLFASSVGKTLQQISQKQAQFRPHHHIEGSASSIHSLNFWLNSNREDKASTHDFAVEQAVVDEAERGRFKLRGISFFGRIGPYIDVWDIFREHLQACREDRFDWTNDNLKKEYAKAYELCKGHVVADTDILVTTTGNARCAEIMDHWLQAWTEYGIPYKGVVVLADEAYKETELGTWNAIMAPGSKTKGVLMFGDDFQLAPTNTTSKGKLAFGHFNAQLDTPLPTRLMRNGFPNIYLKEQQRMHPCLSSFPNREFYSGQLRDGERVKITLEASMPGLSDVLHGIIESSVTYCDDGMLERNRASKTDEKARHAYIQVAGERLQGDDGTSSYVQEHIDVFFKRIFPALQTYFGPKTSKNLMIICAYTAAKVRYRAKIEELQANQELSENFYPSVEQARPRTDAPSSNTRPRDSVVAPPPGGNKKKKLNPESAYSRYMTIDSAQGQESFMVVLDGSWQHKDKIGFMTDRGRCNVAMTRAKGVFWMIGGALEALRERNNGMELSPFPKLKQEMQQMGRVHMMSP